MRYVGDGKASRRRTERGSRRAVRGVRWGCGCGGARAGDRARCCGSARDACRSARVHLAWGVAVLHTTRTRPRSLVLTPLFVSYVFFTSRSLKMGRSPNPLSLCENEPQRGPQSFSARIVLLEVSQERYNNARDPGPTYGLGQGRLSRFFPRNLGGPMKRENFREIWAPGQFAISHREA